MRLAPLLILLICRPLVPADASQNSDPAEQAVAEIRHLGGKVRWSEDRPSKSLAAVNLHSTKVVDADLMHLKHFRSLSELSLSALK
ncbi:MAG TPA: hypothetical protein VEL76_26065 [Gemmataceae bacterium]|nr:hypothetical protein [Gemmataceae bacterium]